VIREKGDVLRHRLGAVSTNGYRSNIAESPSVLALKFLISRVMCEVQFMKRSILNALTDAASQTNSSVFTDYFILC